MKPSVDPAFDEILSALIGKDFHTAFTIGSEHAAIGNPNARHFPGWMHEQGIACDVNC